MANRGPDFFGSPVKKPHLQNIVYIMMSITALWESSIYRELPRNEKLTQFLTLWLPKAVISIGVSKSLVKNQRGRPGKLDDNRRL